MIFNMNALLWAPLIKPIENAQALKDVVKQQGDIITSFNKMLGCDRPDAAKVKYDAERAAKAGKNEGKL